MRHLIRLLPIGILVLMGVNASAQGFYYNYTFDGSWLGTSVTDDPGAPNGSCGGTGTTWSDLNGDYLSGGAVYPNSVTLTDGLYPAESVDYTWTFGFDTVVLDPYGNCYDVQGSYSEVLGLHVTYWGPPVRLVQGQYTFNCQYGSLACTSGTPTCADNTIAYGFYTACPTMIIARYLVAGGTTCIVGAAYDASQETDRPCT